MKSQESLLTKIFIFLFALIVFIFGETLFVNIYASRRDTPYVGTLRELLELACVFCIILAFVFSAKSFFTVGVKNKYDILRNAILLLLVATFLFTLSHFLIFAQADCAHIDCNPFSFILFLFWIFVSVCFKWINGIL